MIVELHIIQNFVPSNLNRDDANAPKDCVFGGYRRARISSQCIKRSVRKHSAFYETVQNSGGNIGIRTKRLKSRLVNICQDQGKSQEEAKKAATTIIELLGLKLSDDEKTEYLLYFGENEVVELATIAINNWELLQKAEKKKDKKDSVAEELKDVQKEVGSVVSKNRTDVKSYAADIALFGRMVADRKSINMNVDAACQVAHAISTHKVEMEMDYFTAVDDLLPDEDSGSDMIGVVEFNSSCFYRYSLIDIEKLKKNLGLNSDLLNAAVLGYLEASIKAIPTGKQNSMAAQNPVSYARLIVRKGGFPWSLANAFQKPVTLGRNQSIEESSIAAMKEYFDSLAKIYGIDSIIEDCSFDIHDPESRSLKELLKSISASLSKEVTA